MKRIICEHCGIPIIEPYAYAVGKTYYCEECVLYIAEDLRNTYGPIYEAFLDAMNKHIEEIQEDDDYDVSAGPDRWEDLE